MMNPSFFAIFPVLLCVLVNAAPAVNTPIQVTLRIEGATSTIFEGPITTSGHNVSTPSAGSHECDGLNQSANSQSGATAIAALSDGASVHGFGFDGIFVDEFDDFILNQIGGETTDFSSSIWLTGVNFFPQAVLEGCHQEIHSEDQVIFALTDNPGTPIFLKLVGPSSAQLGQAVTLTVIDGFLQTRIHGVQVGGQTTDQNGQVVVTLTQLGLNSFKADGTGFVRSNGLSIQVAA